MKHTLIIKNAAASEEFAIAGGDKRFALAKAKIDSAKIVMWNDNIKNCCLCILLVSIIQ